MLLTASPALSQLSLAPLFSSAPVSSSSSVTNAAFPPKSSTSHFSALRSSSQPSGVVVFAAKNASNGFFEESSEKGEALHAMELALPLEKLTNDVAEDIDVQLTHFVGSEFLSEEEEASSVMMAVPKKRRSHTKTKIRKNIWKRKGYTAAMKAFSLAKSLLTGNSKSFFSDK